MGGRGEGVGDIRGQVIVMSREGPGPLGTVLGHIIMQSQHRAGCLKWNVLQKPRRHGLWLLSDLVKTGGLLFKRLNSFQKPFYRLAPVWRSSGAT